MGFVDFGEVALAEEVGEFEDIVLYFFGSGCFGHYVTSGVIMHLYLLKFIFYFLTFLMFYFYELF